MCARFCMFVGRTIEHGAPLQLPLSLHFPKAGDVRISVIHHKNRSRHCHRIKQLLHQLLLVWPRIGKKYTTWRVMAYEEERGIEDKNLAYSETARFVL